MSWKHWLPLVCLLACGGPATDLHARDRGQASLEMPPPPADPSARLDWALAGPQRSEYRDRFGAPHSNRSRDAFRHPKEMLTFFGLEPTMTVVELWPGGGWFTEILAPFLRDQGKLVVTNDDLATASAASKRWALQYEDKLRKEPTVYGKVEIRRTHPPFAIVLGPDDSADMVLTFRNLHNWIAGGFEKTVLDASFRVLKHGGTFGIEEHRGDPGADRKSVVDTGYVPEQLAIELVQAAGFELVGKSDVNANPKDDHHHEGGVWDLPPDFPKNEADRGKYVGVGESDRMTLKFRKP